MQFVTGPYHCVSASGRKLYPVAENAMNVKVRSYRPAMPAEWPDTRPPWSDVNIKFVQPTMSAVGPKSQNDIYFTAFEHTAT